LTCPFCDEPVIGGFCSCPDEPEAPDAYVCPDPYELARG
jgi:hypothetical protein